MCYKSMPKEAKDIFNIHDILLRQGALGPNERVWDHLFLDYSMREKPLRHVMLT